MFDTLLNRDKNARFVNTLLFFFRLFDSCGDGGGFVVGVHVAHAHQVFMMVVEERKRSRSERDEGGCNSRRMEILMRIDFLTLLP